MNRCGLSCGVCPVCVPVNATLEAESSLYQPSYLSLLMQISARAPSRSDWFGRLQYIHAFLLHSPEEDLPNKYQLPVGLGGFQSRSRRCGNGKNLFSDNRSLPAHSLVIRLIILFFYLEDGSSKFLSDVGFYQAFTSEKKIRFLFDVS
jgi:hypothetical protein